MAIDKKIIEEIKRHNRINTYIMEQDAALGDAPAADPTLGAEVPPAADATTPPAAPGADMSDPTLAGATSPEPQVIDTATDSEVEKIDSTGMGKAIIQEIRTILNLKKKGRKFCLSSECTG